ncbi:hypothetical protein HPP92_025600 [Vanilla planifolia]|uniref:AT3G52170-like helix-turn-helix domain-containing protein n=1 Tax=Vanilla planifolia TaxID=51239 RepID=A0A835UB71_VANPL|nr:hypothetical protein HPP92_025600 [Vanilla planifolia]
MLMQITARRFTASSSRKDLFEVSNATNSNNIWCWKPSSSRISSDTSTLQHRRRVTKHERHAMVLAFVEKYMVSNAGKFPTASCIKKQVGGSYYVIREISQKLEYSWKMASAETRRELMPGKVENVKIEDAPDIIASAKQMSSEECAAHATEVAKGSRLKVEEGIERFSINPNLSLCPQIDVDVLRQAINDSLEDNNMGFDNLSASSSASVGTTIKLQTHKSLETTDAGEGKFCVPGKLKTQTDLLTPAKERGEVSEDASSTGNSQSAHVSMRKMMNNEEVSRSEEVNHWEQQSNASSSKGLDLWGNLKSMALGIIHLWKR